MWMDMTNEVRKLRKIFGIWIHRALENGENYINSSFMLLFWVTVSRRVTQARRVECMREI
jgi:hypothetical protein